MTCNSVGRLFLFNHNSLIMKQKIKEALRQEYKSRLELDDDRLDGVAAFASTFVTDESKIEEFVKNDATLAMLKSYQSVLDKDRAKRKANPEAKEQPSDNGNQPPEPKPKPKPQETPDFKAMFAEALAEVVNPLKEELANLKSEKAKETAVAALDKFCADWDYAGGFPKERDEAKRIALKIYKAGGEQMNGEQLIAAFREEFDPAVKSKGVTDFSQPFKSDGGAGTKPDFSADVELMKSEGVDFGE